MDEILIPRSVTHDDIWFAKNICSQTYCKNCCYNYEQSNVMWIVKTVCRCFHSGLQLGLAERRERDRDRDNKEGVSVIIQLRVDRGIYHPVMCNGSTTDGFPNTPVTEVTVTDHCNSPGARQTHNSRCAVSIPKRTLSYVKLC